MKCYSDTFRYEGDNNPYPSEAHVFASVSEAVSKYGEFVADSEKFGFGKPAPLWLYFGTPDGDEGIYGYPNFPDRYIRVGPRGGIIVENGE